MNRIIAGISVVIALLFVGQLAAAPLNCASTGSFAGLLATNAAGGCYVQDHLFSNFTYLASASGPGVASVNASDFFYTTVEDAPNAVGFEFEFILRALANTSGNISIGWLIEGPNILSHHLILSAATSGNAVAIAQTTYCKGGPVAGCPPAAEDQLETMRGAGVATQMSDTKYFDPVDRLGVSTNLSVFAAGAGATATITGLRQTIDPPLPDAIPEPATLALTGAALLSLSFIRFRRS